MIRRKDRREREREAERRGLRDALTLNLTPHSISLSFFLRRRRR
jgi:hypothetical protein